MRRRYRTMTAGLLLVVVACTVEKREPDDDVESGLGGPCDSSSDCDNGLTCSVGSRIAGLCTTPCTNTTECQVSFGDSALCVDGFCVRACEFDPHCPGGACDESDGICVTVGACSEQGNGCDPAGKPCCDTATRECKETKEWGNACCWDPRRGPGTCNRHSDCCAPAICNAGACCLESGVLCSTANIPCCGGSCLASGACP